MTGPITITDEQAASFPFKLRPFLHQYTTFMKTRDVYKWALLPEMGCGKTKIALDTAAHLFLSDKIDLLVVIAPNSVFRAVWEDEEVDKHMSPAVSYRAAHFSSHLRVPEKKKLEWVLTGRPTMHGRFLRVILMNVEGFVSQSSKATIFLKNLIRMHDPRRTMVVIDESTTIKNRVAHRTRILTRLCQSVAYKRIMTGNPNPNGLLDMYSQASFLGPELVRHMSYFEFRNEYAILQEIQIPGQRAFKQVVGFKNVDRYQTWLGSFSTIIKKKDCLDLPEKIYAPPRYVEMSPQQSAMYESLLRDSFLELDRAESSGLLTADLVLTKLLRLHQITCGFVSPDGMEEVPIYPNPRLAALVEILEENKNKWIVWCTYTHNIKVITQRLKEVFGQAAVAAFYGETSLDERAEIKQQFQDANSPLRGMVANSAAGKYGMTLTEADLVVYYSNDYNSEKRQQSEDRAHRIGQTKNVVYVDLVCPGTVDEKIIKKLKAKEALSNSVLISNWRELLMSR